MWLIDTCFPYEHTWYLFILVSEQIKELFVEHVNQGLTQLFDLCAIPTLSWGLLGCLAASLAPSH